MNGKVILISGNKRAGKTTFSVKLQKELGFNYYSFDNIMDAVEDEFKVDCNDENHYYTFLDSFLEFIKEQAKNYGINAVIDTLYYMPSELQNFKNLDNVDVYYLSNLDATEENIRDDFKKYSKSFDWPSYVSEEDIERNVKFLLERNELLKEECPKYNCRLINTSRGENREIILNQLLEEVKQKLETDDNLSL